MSRPSSSAFPPSPPRTPTGAAARIRQTQKIPAADPATEAATIEQLREKLFGGPPDHVVVAPSDSPGFAMPAASWAARSGDPVLFASKDNLPKVTASVLVHLRDKPVY